MQNITVAFVGLPSSGKSTLINSLCKKSLVCSSDKNVIFIGNKIGNRNVHNLSEVQFIECDCVSDDDVPFSIFYLPGLTGICDAEKIFSLVDIVLWVSDVKTAFDTVHEIEEFDKMILRLKKIQVSKMGKLCQVGIMLSKCDHCDNESIEEHYDEVARIFENNDYPIFKFSAFGRIINRSNMDVDLVKMCQGITSNKITGNNNEFNLKWATDDYAKKQQMAYLNVLITYHYQNQNVDLGLCAYGFPLSDKFYCSMKNYCKCISACDHCCHYHGVCSNGKLKSQRNCDDPTCKYHNNQKCIYGISVTDQDAVCNVKCHYHYNKSNAINQTFRQIHNKDILNSILTFAQIISNMQLRKFFDKHNFHLVTEYNQQHHDAFFNMLSPSKFFEDCLPANQDIVKNNKTIYIRLTKIASVDNIIIMRNLFTLVQNKTMPYDNSTKVYLPKISEIDFEFKINKMVSLKKSWVDNVASLRETLWNDDNIDIHMVITNVWNNGGLVSLFSPIK